MRWKSAEDSKVLSALLTSEDKAKFLSPYWQVHVRSQALSTGPGWPASAWILLFAKLQAGQKRLWCIPSLYSAGLNNKMFMIVNILYKICHNKCLFPFHCFIASNYIWHLMLWRNCKDLFPQQTSEQTVGCSGGLGRDTVAHIHSYTDISGDFIIWNLSILPQ